MYRTKNIHIGLFFTLFIFLILLFLTLPCRAQVSESTLQATAESYMESTSYIRAIQAFSELTAQFSNSTAIPEAIYYIGKSYFRLGDVDNAHKFLQQVISKYPNDPYAANAQRMLGYVYFEKKDYDNSLAAFELYAKLYPSSPFQEDVTRRIAGIKHALNRRFEALKTFNYLLDSPLANDSIKCEVQLQKAGVMFELTKGEDQAYRGPPLTWDTVRLELAKVQDSYPNGPRAYHSRAKVMEAETYDMENRFTEEFSCISTNLKEYPDILVDVILNHYNMGRSYLRMGKYTESRNKFQWILATFDEKTSNNYLAKRVLSHCFYGTALCALYTGDKATFKQMAEEFKAKYPDSPEVITINGQLKNIDSLPDPPLAKPRLPSQSAIPKKGSDNE